MKKLMMFLGVLFVGTFFASFVEVGYFPGVRLYYDFDGDGYHCRTSIPPSEYKYNSMLEHGFWKTGTLGKESGVNDHNFHVH